MSTKFARSSDGRICIPHTDWLVKTTGLFLFLIGFVLTVTVIGALIGVPLVLGSLGMLFAPKTLRGTPCH